MPKMLLHRIHLDLRCREARRDLADPYQLHATLCRAFAPPNEKCPPSTVLWRLEPETDAEGNPRVMIQSRRPADWDRIGVRGWLAHVDPAIDLAARLQIDDSRAHGRFRFRLRANPCVTRNGKRLGLMRLPEKEDWLNRKGDRHGFSLPQLERDNPDEGAASRPDVRISQPQMLGGRQHDGNGIRIFSVLYDGFLTVTDPVAFIEGLRSGIGHGKALGLGLLSIAPVA
jgi:CRISPR system Cascade subunit CasE